MLLKAQQLDLPEIVTALNTRSVGESWINNSIHKLVEKGRSATLHSRVGWEEKKMYPEAGEG